MRLLQMLNVAVQAEGIVLRREMRGLLRQAGWLAFAIVFAMAALVTAHVAALAHFAPRHGMAVAAVIVAVADVVIAAVLLLFARRRADPIAAEARSLRETMLTAMTRRDPMRDALGLALRSGVAPVFGAVAGDVVAALFRRRR